MKKSLVQLGLFLTTINGFGQTNDGKKVITSTLSNFYFGRSKGEATSSINPTLTTKTSGFGFATEVTYGKIKKNNLFSYGLNIAFGFNKQSDNTTTPANSKNHRIVFGPVISCQKFYKITEKLYYSPYSRLSLGYSYYKQNATPFSSASIQKGMLGSLTFHPFSITFSKSPKTNFLFTIGRVSIDYSRVKSYYDPILNNSQTISTNFLLSAQIGGIGFGIQKLF